ncbi:MAG: bifunctional folylpolyglutamate synthase/dihydrofolate synthase [Mariniphaga sp.]|nr:bifunctional folylpolyglutamate synthase/dihydrofolate synthase [Mariniphaga sp.]
MDSYNDILDYLYNQLPMFQRSGPPAYKNTLGNSLELDKLYNRPHQNYKTIHVAGTNGKGSVSHLLAGILQKAGYKTGLYTSPHLKDFRERIKINGKMVEKEFVVSWVNDFKEKNKNWELDPSFFELTVAMAFDYFSQQNVEIAVIEVGLGGRLDSTNIIFPEISVITNISYDHTNLLGETLIEIASEKAGIIKEGIPIVIGRTQEETKNVFIEKAANNNAPIYFADQVYFADYSLQTVDGKQVLNVRRNQKIVYPELKTGLTGLYQRENVITVLKVCDLLKEKDWCITDRDIYKGLDEVIQITGILGRWQRIGYNPLIICDTGHNEDGIRAIVDQLEQTAYKNLHLIFGTVSDKNLQGILSILPIEAIYYFTRADIPRALDEKVLQNQALEYGLTGKSYSNVTDAFEAAKKAAGKDDLIFIGGSTFVVAEVLP